MCTKRSEYPWGYCTNPWCSGGNDLESKARREGFDNADAALRSYQTWQREQALRDEREQERLKKEHVAQEKAERRRRAEEDAAAEREARRVEELRRAEEAVARLKAEQPVVVDASPARSQPPPPWLKSAAPEAFQLQEKRNRAAAAAEWRANPTTPQPKAISKKALAMYHAMMAKKEAQEAVAAAQAVRHAASTNSSAQPKSPTMGSLKRQVASLKTEVNKRAREAFKYRGEVRQSAQANRAASAAAEAAQAQTTVLRRQLQDAQSLLEAERAIRIRATGRRLLKRGPSSSPVRRRVSSPMTSEPRRGRGGRKTPASSETSTPAK